MKKYIEFIIFMSLALVNTSCKDFLNTESKSSFVESTVFNNYDFAQKAVLGIYGKMHEDAMYGWNLSLYFNLDTDIEFNGGADDGDKRSLGRYVEPATSGMTKNTWNALYSAIERANICIDNLGPESPLWKGEQVKEVQRLYGESLALRALFYYDLMKYWGDVPWCGQSFKEGVPFFQYKTDRDSIYEVVIENLKTAEQYVPWTSEIQTTKRFGKSFVKGLRARMALSYAGFSLRNKTFETRRGPKWEEYYKIAHDECQEIMQSGQHRLYPNYELYFRMFHEYKMELDYGETLYELAFGRDYNGNICNHIGMTFPNAGDDNYGRSSIDIRTTPYMYYCYDTKDLRRNVNVELYNYASSSRPGKQSLVPLAGDQFTHTKWRKNWIVPAMGGVEKGVGPTGVGFPLMRYTDVVLLFAETENEINNGPTAAAKEALASVRRRAFKPEDYPLKVDHYIDSVSASKESFFDALVNERAWEFCGELVRKNDLVRWNLLGKKIQEVKDECLKIFADDPKYQWIPNRIYWRDTPGNSETIDIYNPDFRISVSPGSGWTMNTWLSGQSDANKTTFKTNIINRVAYGYDPAKNNYLFPIHSDIITDSRGYLENDQLPK